LILENDTRKKGGVGGEKPAALRIHYEAGQIVDTFSAKPVGTLRNSLDSFALPINFMYIQHLK